MIAALGICGDIRQYHRNCRWYLSGGGNFVKLNHYFHDIKTILLFICLLVFFSWNFCFLCINICYFILDNIFRFASLPFLHLSGCLTANPGPLSKGHCHSPNVNHCIFVNFWPKGHWEPYNEPGSLSLAEHLVGFEPGAFWFIHDAKFS